MNGVVRFISHPDVRIDPTVPVPDWGLSERGLERLDAMLRQAWIKELAAVWSSEERKANEAGTAIATASQLPLRMLKQLGEIDRSATGYMHLGHDENAQAFFDQPEQSARGWERAVDAQARILRAIESVVEQSPAGDIAVVSHGAVGTLLLCALNGVPIARSEDQPGQGHGFTFERATRRLLHGWIAIEDVH